VYIVTIGEICAVVAAAAFLASQCRQRNQPPDGQYAGGPPILRVQHTAASEHVIHFFPGRLEGGEGSC